MSKIRTKLDNVTRQARNLGTLNINLERFTEAGAFFWRKSFSEGMEFTDKGTDKDYTYIKTQTDIDVCTKVNLKVEQLCGFNDWQVIAEGNTTRLDCEFLNDSCRVKCDISPIDEYSCVLENWERKVNILDNPNRQDIDYRNFSHIEFTVDPSGAPIAGFGAPLDPQGTLGASYTLTCPAPVPISTDYWLYGRIIERTRCIGGQPEEPPPSNSTWNLLSNDCGVDGTATWWRRPVGGGVDYIVFLPIAVSCQSIPPPPPFCTPPAPPPQADIQVASGIIVGHCVYDLWIDTTGSFPSQNLQNGRFLLETIDFMLSEYGCGLTVRSDFFTNVTNPVTGNPNALQDLVLYQKSDIVRSGSSEVASLGELSLKEILNDLRILFNVRWFVDSGTNELVIEHISDISQTVGIDLTALDGGKWAKNQNSVTYNKPAIPGSEEFLYANPASGIDFVGFPIVYDSTCATNRAEQIRTEQIETEVRRIFQNEEEGLTGFVLISPSALNQYDPNAENGRITGLFQSNAPLAWGALLDDYYRDDRPLPSGTINNLPVVFNSTKKLSEQNTIKFPMCCLNDFNPLNLIRTEVGDGENGQIIYSLNEGTLTVNLKQDL